MSTHKKQNTDKDLANLILECLNVNHKTCCKKIEKDILSKLNEKNINYFLTSNFNQERKLRILSRLRSSKKEIFDTISPQILQHIFNKQPIKKERKNQEEHEENKELFLIVYLEEEIFKEQEKQKIMFQMENILTPNIIRHNIMSNLLVEVNNLKVENQKLQEENKKFKEQIQYNYGRSITILQNNLIKKDVKIFNEEEKRWTDLPSSITIRCSKSSGQIPEIIDGTPSKDLSNSTSIDIYLMEPIHLSKFIIVGNSPYYLNDSFSIQGFMDGEEKEIISNDDSFQVKEGKQKQFKVPSNIMKKYMFQHFQITHGSSQYISMNTIKLLSDDEKFAKNNGDVFKTYLEEKKGNYENVIIDSNDCYNSFHLQKNGFIAYADPEKPDEGAWFEIEFLETEICLQKYNVTLGPKIWQKSWKLQCCDDEGWKENHWITIHEVKVVKEKTSYRKITDYKEYPVMTQISCSHFRFWSENSLYFSGVEFEGTTLPRTFLDC